MFRISFNRIAALGAAALAVGGVVAATAQGNFGQEQGAPPPGGPGGPQFGGPGGPGFGGGRFGGGFGGGTQLTATSTNVYILRGPMLYSLDAHTLKLVAQAQLPAPAAPAQPAQ